MQTITPLGYMPGRLSDLIDEQSVAAEPRNFVSSGQRLFHVFSLVVIKATLFFLFLVILL